MPLVLNGDAYAAFRNLAEKQLASSDFDAEHPVYNYLVQKYSIGEEESTWLSFLYMAYYDEASAWVTFLNSDPFTIPKNVALPIGTNRRNLFGGKIVTHFESLAELRQSASEWPKHDFTGEPIKDWFRLKETLGTIWGNGRFGQYTTSEMLHKVNGFPVEVGDFDNRRDSKPTDGVKRLYNYLGNDLKLIDSSAELIYKMFQKEGLKPTYTELDRGVVESILCNYSGVCRGRFYSGRNLDRQWDRITKVESKGYDLHDLWEAREAVFRREDLCEFGEWKGVDRSRLRLYMEKGEMPWVYEGR